MASIGQRAEARLDSAGDDRRHGVLRADEVRDQRPRLPAAGTSSPAIGEAPFISPRTDRVYVPGILARLGVSSRTEAIVGTRTRPSSRA